MVHFLFRTAEVDVHTWLSMDDSCYWKKPVTALQKALSEDIPVERFCDPIARDDRIFPSIPKSEFQRSLEYSLILAGKYSIKMLERVMLV